MESKIEISIILAWLVVFFLVMVIIVFTLNYRTKILKSEKEKQINAFKAAIEAEENQKEKIANNLHDEIIPLLTVLAQNIRSHKTLSRDTIVNPKDYNNDLNILEQSIQSMRAIALDLIPTTFLNFGLLKALEQYAAGINDAGRFVELEIHPEVTRELNFSKQIQVNIYRICMELLHNLRKHEQYTHLNISIQNSPDKLQIKFTHDGAGVDNADIENYSKNSTGLGLRSLKSRALIINATLDYDKQDVASILLTIPYNGHSN